MLKAVTLVAAMLMVSVSIRFHSAQTEKPSQWAMDNALIGPDSPIEVPAGGTYNAKVMYPVPDGPFFRLKGDVTWWIEPAVKGIFIEAKSGTISVAPTVPPGTLALLHADVTGRKEKLHAKLYVFSPKTDPLVGNWKLDSTQECGSGAKGTPVAQAKSGDDINWKFHVNREFWIGRELSIRPGVQQYGTYEYNPAHSTLILKPKWPATQSESHWKVHFNPGDAIELTSGRGHKGDKDVCRYVLHKASQAD